MSVSTKPAPIPSKADAEQLYDVCWAADKKAPGDAKFMMRAPARVIRHILDMHPSGYERMLMETEKDGSLSLIYTNGRSRLFGDSVFAVMKSRVPLETMK